MMGMLYEILRPFSYLTIKHHKKSVFDWWIPLLLTVTSSAFFYIFPLKINLIGENSILSELKGFIQILPGFYIAALAAIATFNRNDIDKTMPYPAPKVDVRIGDKSNEIELTRRRFLCMLFSFLTALSFSLCIVAIFVNAIDYSCEDYAFLTCDGLGLLVLSVYMLFFWQLMSSTSLGLFYLGDRLHQPDP